MMFEGSLFTPTPTVEACAALFALTNGCQPNYTDEWLQNEIFTDYSQSSFPMSLIASVPMTNTNVVTISSTGDCMTILPKATSATGGFGLFQTPNTYNTFGGCSRMDIDETSQTVACANQTNHSEPLTSYMSPFNRTMVISYTGAAGNGATANPTILFNPAVQVLGGIYFQTQVPQVGGVNIVPQ